VREKVVGPMQRPRPGRGAKWMGRKLYGPRQFCWATGPVSIYVT
jgi:hypothetical protein